jgi:hypothetical protein
VAVETDAAVKPRGVLLGHPRWHGETCRKCGRRNVVGFVVSDEAWEAVVGDPGTIWCPQCFDVVAQARGVRYRFLEVYPVSWSDWEDGKDDAH